MLVWFASITLMYGLENVQGVSSPLVDFNDCLNTRCKICGYQLTEALNTTCHGCFRSIGLLPDGVDHPNKNKGDAKLWRPNTIIYNDCCEVGCSMEDMKIFCHDGCWFINTFPIAWSGT
uniref:Uncharacterized protein n=1 Tax=Romanomermis culicivorax TaxID=13658 RepID=A0A915KCL1_ROMCU